MVTLSVKYFIISKQQLNECIRNIWYMKMLRICIHNNVTNKSHSIQRTFVSKRHNFISKGYFNTNFTLTKRLSTKIQDERDCVYYGPLTPQIKAVKVFSISSSAAGLLAQPIIIKEAVNIGSTSLLVALCSIVGFFTFVTPVLLHFITKKYVTRMYYDPHTSIYTAVIINFFLIPKQIEFKPEDVEIPDIVGMFTTFHAKGKPLFVDARHFPDPNHYAKIMGYDKPMDFKLKKNFDDNKPE